MAYFNWAKKFQEQPTCDDILAKIQKMEKRYWFWLVISVVLSIIGLHLVFNAPEENIKMHFLGVFLALEGVILIALIKIWAHIYMAMYRIIWDNVNRIESEIRKSEAEDL